MLSAIRWVVTAISSIVCNGPAQTDRSGPVDPAVALAAMPVFVREVYLLRRVDGLTHHEIALRLGISLHEVRRLLREAVRILRSGS